MGRILTNSAAKAYFDAITEELDVAIALKPEDADEDDPDFMLQRSEMIRNLTTSLKNISEAS